jgi:hypothetical protein
MNIYVSRALQAEMRKYNGLINWSQAAENGFRAAMKACDKSRAKRKALRLAKQEQRKNERANVTRLRIVS